MTLCWGGGGRGGDRHSGTNTWEDKVTYALDPVAVRKVWTIFHRSKVNWEAIRYGWYMLEATRLAPNAAPVMIVSILSE